MFCPVVLQAGGSNGACADDVDAHHLSEAPKLTPIQRQQNRSRDLADFGYRVAAFVHQNPGALLPPDLLEEVIIRIQTAPPYRSAYPNSVVGYISQFVPVDQRQLVRAGAGANATTPWAAGMLAQWLAGGKKSLSSLSMSREARLRLLINKAAPTALRVLSVDDTWREVRDFLQSLSDNFYYETTILSLPVPEDDFVERSETRLHVVMQEILTRLSLATPEQAEHLLVILRAFPLCRVSASCAQNHWRDFQWAVKECQSRNPPLARAIIAGIGECLLERNYLKRDIKRYTKDTQDLKPYHDWWSQISRPDSRVTPDPFLQDPLLVPAPPYEEMMAYRDAPQHHWAFPPQDMQQGPCLYAPPYGGVLTGFGLADVHAPMLFAPMPLSWPAGMLAPYAQTAPILATSSGHSYGAPHFHPYAHGPMPHMNEYWSFFPPQ